MADHARSFISEVHRSLKLDVNVHCKFSVPFRIDVFNLLFNCKSALPPTGRGKFYELGDFPSTYFPLDWFVVYDKLGNGCKIDFPVRV